MPPGHVALLKAGEPLELISIWTYFWHLAFAVSAKCQIINFVLNHKILGSFLKFWVVTEEANIIRKFSWGVHHHTGLQAQGPNAAYLRFTPQDEDLCHHAEELVRVCIGAFEPVRSEVKDKWVPMQEFQWLKQSLISKIYQHKIIISR